MRIRDRLHRPDLDRSRHGRRRLVTSAACVAWVAALHVQPGAVRAADAARTAPGTDPAWPPVTSDCRPFAYNWWLGSAVDRENLARELKRWADGGLGGIHVIPIYGARGAEPRYVEYLSPAWLETFRFAIEEAERLGLKVDTTTGTGWNFGGPNIPRERGGWRLETKVLDVPADGEAPGTIAWKEAQAAVAVAADGERVDLRPRIGSSGDLDWRPGPKAWKVSALLARPGGPEVERAAPGGAGWMLNPFDPEAMRLYLERFTEAFSRPGARLPRAMYHDSFEYGSSWAPGLLDAFAAKRGYRLEDEIPALCGDPSKDDRAARVRADFKETISDVMADDVFPQWIRWCRERGVLTRNQAHGSPGNILDLYALADIPETEMFGRGGRDPQRSGFDERFGEGDRSPLVSKFASSVAHVAGKRLVAAETGTWMAEHFCETLEELKCFADLFFVSGVNHIVYHGTCYSPDDAAWPGWLFYASTQMNPRNAIWRDAPALNGYIARCQAVLRAGAPDADVLLYWPIHDLWHGEARLVSGCGVHGRAWFEGQPVGAAARALWARGYAFDYVSDRLLAGARAIAPVGPGVGRLETLPHDVDLPGASALAAESGVPEAGRYRAVLVPPTRRMPVGTMALLVALAEAGATVIFQDALPDDVPGLRDLEARRATLRGLLDRNALERRLEPGGGGEVREAAMGPGRLGRIIVGPLEPALARARVRREPLSDHPGALWVRRRHQDGLWYFVANQATAPLSGWIGLATRARSVLALDPMSGRTGAATTREGSGGGTEVLLHLEPGHSIILRTEDRGGEAVRIPRDPGSGAGTLVAAETEAGGAVGPQAAAERAPPAGRFRFLRPGAVAAEVRGPWQVEFVAGGPELPKPYRADALLSWTANGDPETERFAGTARYAAAFDAPAGTGAEAGAAESGTWILDLGRVCHSARVRLNGEDLGALIMAPYRLELPALKPTGNVLEVEVTNLSANRIRDLDRRKVPWRIFHEINFVNIRYQAFDASGWPVLESGLLGPVTIRAAEEVGG